MEGMKQTVRDWYGDFPSKWDAIKFRLGFSFSKGLNITKEDLIDEGVPVISYGQVHAKDNPGTGIVDSLLRFVPDTYLAKNKACLVHEGDFIFADTSEDYAGVGNVAFVDRETIMFAGYHTIVARPILETIYPKYYAYLFLTDSWRDQIRANVMGVKVFSVTNKLLRDTFILLPPIEEQKRIANFLDNYCGIIDEAIDILQKEIDVLLKYKKSIISEAVTGGLNEHEDKVSSGIDWIGDIPKSWSIKPLNHVSTLRNGYVGPTRDLFVDDGIMYLQSLHIKEGNITFENYPPYYVPEKWATLHPKIKTNDVLIVQTGDIGQIGLVTSEYDGCSCHALIIATPDTNMIRGEYLRYYFMSAVGMDSLMMYQTGTTLLHLNSTKIKRSKIIVPPTDEQTEIVEFLDKKMASINGTIEGKHKALQKMQEYKKSVINEYVTGKKSVREVM